jgi:hypothetical protein
MVPVVMTVTVVSVVMTVAVVVAVVAVTVVLGGGLVFSVWLRLPHECSRPSWLVSALGPSVGRHLRLLVMYHELYYRSTHVSQPSPRTAVEPSTSISVRAACSSQRHG